MYQLVVWIPVSRLKWARPSELDKSVANQKVHHFNNVINCVFT
jgi:hypothetical protein